MTETEYVMNDAIMRIPTHPGILLKEDVLPSLRLSIAQCARELSISRQTLHRLLNGSHPITPIMALKIGRFCNTNPILWLRMQQAYDLKQAELKLGDDIERIPVHLGVKIGQFQ